MGDMQDVKEAVDGGGVTGVFPFVLAELAGLAVKRL